MKAAVMRGAGQPWSVEEVHLADPAPDEVVVRMEAAGLCRSDHQLATGALPMGRLPMVGGHEGAGVIVAAGPDAAGLRVGQHVVMSCAPSCDACSPCRSGRPTLCDRVGEQRSTPGTFAPFAVAGHASVIPIDESVPFEVACLLGCAIPTGWGAVTRTADVRPADDVVVIGLGGVGMTALCTAVIAGARHVIGIDPVPWKREFALKHGATHAYSDAQSALGEVAMLTRGLMAQKVVVAVGQPHGADVDGWLTLTAKGGVCVLAALADIRQSDVTLNLAIQVLMQKRVRGTRYGAGNPYVDVGSLTALYAAGKLPLDDFVTRRYRLADINDGFADLVRGDIVRGVIRYEEDDWTG